MGLIKAGEAPPSLAVFSMADVEKTARLVLARARHQADQILAATQTEAERLKIEAKEQGFAEGRAQGFAQGRQEGQQSGHAEALEQNRQALAQLIQALTAATAQLDELRGDLQTEALTEVVQLACSLARKVTKRQGMIDPQVLSENLKDAMSLAVHAADVRIGVHPSQLKTLEAELPNLRLLWPHHKHIELVEDPTLTPGGARIFTTHGQVDGDLDTQLDRIVGELMPQSLAGAL